MQSLKSPYTLYNQQSVGSTLHNNLLFITIRLPSDSTSRWTPLSLAVSFPLSGHFTDLHRLDYAHAGRTKKPQLLTK